MSQEEILMQISRDLGKLTQASETQTGQIAELFRVVNDLKDKKCEDEGKEKANTDTAGRIMAAINLIFTGVVAWFYLKGGH